MITFFRFVTSGIKNKRTPAEHRAHIDALSQEERLDRLDALVSALEQTRLQRAMHLSAKGEDANTNGPQATFPRVTVRFIAETAANLRHLHRLGSKLGAQQLHIQAIATSAIENFFAASRTFGNDDHKDDQAYVTSRSSIKLEALKKKTAATYSRPHDSAHYQLSRRSVSYREVRKQTQMLPSKYRCGSLVHAVMHFSPHSLSC